MKDYEWITFDCYGTLIDWELGIGAAFEKVARTSWVTFDRKRVLSLFRKYEAAEELHYRRYRDILTIVAKRICLELGFKTTGHDFLVESLTRWRPFPDTNPALQRLARRYKLGILSNVDNNLLADTCRHFVVPFKLIVTAENVASYKPGLNHFQEARRKIGPGRWIHAAQSYFHDINPCSRLGIDSAWINRSYETGTDQNTQPLFIGPDLFAFANWMEDVE